MNNTEINRNNFIFCTLPKEVRFVAAGGRVNSFSHFTFFFKYKKEKNAVKK